MYFSFIIYDFDNKTFMKKLKCKTLNNPKIKNEIINKVNKDGYC